VSERDEHSYYEISLTGVQMVIGFAVLLGCLLVAFFAGVWLGRGGRAAEQAVVARQQEAGQDENATQGKDPASLDQFNFFSNDDQAEPSATPPPKTETAGSGERTTLLEDVGGASRNGKSAPAESAPPTPRQAAGEEATGTTPSRGSEGAAAETSGFVIQVFSTNDRSQAQRVLDRLRDDGMQAFLSPVIVEGRTMHRVRVGPFESRETAESTAAKIRKTYRLDTWITQGG
jgi:cell division septation protein DedD